MTFFYSETETLLNPNGLLPGSRARAVPAASCHWVQLAIARADDDQLLGDFALHRYAHEPRAGRGRAMRRPRCGACSAYCFAELSMHRMLALADTRNLPCVALLESVGLRREGHFRHNGWYKGEWCDEYQYALLASEWAAPC